MAKTVKAVLETALVDSELFYKKIAEKHCKCNCSDPRLRDRYSNRVLIAVDLELPECERESSRYIIWLTECGKCGENLTFGNGFGSYNATGLENLKRLSEKENRKSVIWSDIITSLNDIKL